jgi:hypothetical protein
LHKHKQLVLYILLIVVFFAATACNKGVESILTDSPPAWSEGWVHFFAIAKTFEEREVTIDLGISIPMGNYDYDTQLNAYWLLLDPDNSAISHGFIERVERTPGGSANEKFLDQWQGPLSPGQYYIEWGAPGYGSSRITIDLIEIDGRLSIRNQVTENYPDFPPLRK